MTEKRRIPTWARVALRLPERLYRVGLGSLLGHRFLRLVHVGRRSGRRYAVVLEFGRYDPRVPEHVVVAALGLDADWLRNLEANGTAEVTVGRSTFPAAHRMLDVDEATAVFTGFGQRNRMVGPVLRRVLSWLLGWRYDGSPTARRRMAEQLPLVALRPRAAPAR